MTYLRISGDVHSLDENMDIIQMTQFLNAINIYGVSQDKFLNLFFLSLYLHVPVIFENTTKQQTTM